MATLFEKIGKKLRLNGGQQGRQNASKKRTKVSLLSLLL